jgi:acyl-CoA reductase-like NAD-dependent aldehyde dehydrogenase
MGVHRSSEDTLAFVGGSGSLLIGGEWLAPKDGASFASVDPNTGREICRVAQAGPADVDLAVHSARTALAQWRLTSGAQREALLNRLADLIESRAAELAEIEAVDGGKPRKATERVDVPAAAAQLRYFGGWATKIQGEVIPVAVPNVHVYTSHEPVGVCAQIISWNFPMLNAVSKIAPALAAGNCVVVKPAEQTPLSAIRLGQLILEAGIPPGVVNILTGDGVTGAALVEHPGVDKIAFTGSTEVGREVGAQALRQMKRVTLELGGKSPNIVLADADVASAVKGSYMSMYFNAGQVCQAATRLFVHRSRIDEVVEGVAGRARMARVGSALDLETQVGPVVSREQYSRVASYIEGGLAAGAEAVVGGRIEEQPDGGFFVHPTLLTEVTDDMAVAREEIFGPVLVALPFDDLDEVAARANGTEYGLAAYVWSRDSVAAQRMASLLDAGSVFLNTPALSDPAAPFGGFKASGVGREGGREGLAAYLETKTVWAGLA